MPAQETNEVDWNNQDPATNISRIGIYGWRKRLIYFSIPLIMVISIINLSLVIWVKRTMDVKTGNGPVVPHPVNGNNNYRLWNPVSNGLLVRDGNSVNVNGTFGGSNTVITTSTISRDLVSLLFMDGTNTYVITVQDQNGVKSITAPSSSGGQFSLQTKFKAEYFWSYTLFQTESEPTQYLGCDSNGNATLVNISSSQYPNPQAMFILNQP